ncbi:hypothetical protein LCGC14_3114310, partial [marine sediment metagenome]
EIKELEHKEHRPNAFSGRDDWDTSKYICPYENAPSELTSILSWSGEALWNWDKAEARTYYTFNNTRGKPDYYDIKAGQWYSYENKFLEMTYVIPYDGVVSDISIPKQQLPIPGTVDVAAILDQSQTGTIVSNGMSNLDWQGDGNLVLYIQGRALWSTNTQGNAGATLRFQGDGNLVVYDWASKAIWDAFGQWDGFEPPANTENLGNVALILQADCELVLTDLDSQSVIWRSRRTCQKEDNPFKGTP